MKLPDISESERIDRLERARRRCFFLDLDDVGARLGRANMPFGIAKIHWVQETLGLEPDALYISTPDSTVTRNIDRWASGFGYGGAVEWTGEFFPIELKPNCCGMLVAGLRERPDVDKLEKAIAHLEANPIDVGGPVPALLDVSVGNHFLNVYRSSAASVTKGFEWVAILHSSGKELRRASEHGPGLYLGGPRTGSSLEEIAESVPTPFGNALIVMGPDFETYTAYVSTVESYVKRRRAAYAREFFGPDVEILFNETHQGLDGPNRMLLGCYSTRGRALPWVPVTLRADLPSFLVAPLDIYSKEILEREGLLKTAVETGCLERLTDAAVLPHGGGYAYPDFGGGVEVDDRGPNERRRFRVVGSLDWFEDVRHVPFTYRDEVVIRQIESLGCGQVVAQLEVVDGPNR